MHQEHLCSAWSRYAGVASILRRLAAAIGATAGLGILVAVANADHERYRSYLLMALLHPGVALSGEQAPHPRARSVAVPAERVPSTHPEGSAPEQVP